MNHLDTNNAIFQPNIATMPTPNLTKDWFKRKKYWSFGLAHYVSRFKPNIKFAGNFVKKRI